MAGTTPGASAPTYTPQQRDPRASRTRRGHCAISVSGGAVLSVYSTRHHGDALGVTVNITSNALQLAGAMTPTQARSMARALGAAADAVERQGSAR